MDKLKIASILRALYIHRNHILNVFVLIIILSFIIIIKEIVTVYFCIIMLLAYNVF